MNLSRGLVAIGLAAGFALAGASAAEPAAAQDACHPAYISACLPFYDYDALNCEDIGWAVIQLADPNWDPYNLDALYVAGNGWTCDGIG